MATENLKVKTAGNLAAYNVGDSDTRPWGEYVVTGVGTNAQGEEFCEKRITVNPGQVLSLQSHEYRREHWTVESGTLTVVMDDQRMDLQAGQDVRIPLGAIHCMANLSDKPCVVHEMQEGICGEEDIKRYVDSYGRGTETLTTAKAQECLAHYNDILVEIKQRG